MKTSSPGARLSPWDFRFLAAFVQGVEVKAAWDRYMAHRGSSDVRHIRTTVRMLLDVLATAAKRGGDPVTSALLRRDPLRIKSSPAGMNSSPLQMNSSSKVVTSLKPPSLDEFRDSLEDPDFYSEAELGELWESRFGKGSPAPGRRHRDSPDLVATKRRARLVQRQLDALRRLEQLVAAPPVAQDHLDAWLDAQTSRRLQSVGIERVGELVSFANRHGFRWHRKVPRIGEEGARRLTAWLRHHSDTVGHLQAFALLPVAQVDVASRAPAPATGVVPLERLVVPTALAGMTGENRKPISRCKIKAVNDYQAVLAWLSMYKPDDANGQRVGNRHTYAAYRKEAERFLLWAVFERRKPLSSLDSIDCAAYLRFLQAPGPMWIASKGLPRWSPDWRPFEGPLAPRSLRFAETVCKGLCRWLASQHYLDTNPWDGTPKGGRKTPIAEVHALSMRQQAAVDLWLEQLPRTAANIRLKLLFEMGLRAGLRRVEIAGARVGWLRQDADARGLEGWWIQFYGKGQKERKVPLLPQTAAAIFEWLDFVGLSPRDPRGDIDLAQVDAETPILSRIGAPMEALPPSRVYNLVKDAMAKCAQAQEDPKLAQQLGAASTHWLRHTFGSEWARRGGDLRVLGGILGHSNPATTAIYTRAEDALQRQELERLYR